MKILFIISLLFANFSNGQVKFETYFEDLKKQSPTLFKEIISKLDQSNPTYLSSYNLLKNQFGINNNCKVHYDLLPMGGLEGFHVDSILAINKSPDNQFIISPEDSNWLGFSVAILFECKKSNGTKDYFEYPQIILNGYAYIKYVDGIFVIEKVNFTQIFLQILPGLPKGFTSSGG